MQVIDKKPIVLTPVQRQILQALADGGMLVQDKTNALTVGPLSLQPKTRTILMDASFLTRLDKTRDIKTKGNGYVITDKGRAALITAR